MVQIPDPCLVGFDHRDYMVIPENGVIALPRSLLPHGDSTTIGEDEHGITVGLGHQLRVVKGMPNVLFTIVRLVLELFSHAGIVPQTRRFRQPEA